MLYLYNTLTQKKELFTPIDRHNITMYVCGPTVYERPHIGNARSAVVFDVLYRVLCRIYTGEAVTYIRNVTDIDDKIIAAAKEKNVAISDITQKIEHAYNMDMLELNTLYPMSTPRATDHIQQMIDMIQLLLNNGNAYISEDHVLFDITSYKEHGKLSNRKIHDLQPGARVKVESYKRNPGDFVLWKPAQQGDDTSCVFNSPWGLGRPGWHIECSAMSTHYLGYDFDIHGGGSDLMFPHHENEITQSVCAHPGTNYARYWVHNGFLMVDGKKMSKSDGNFITVQDLLEKGVKGESIRLALLSTKYNEPLDWSEKTLSDAKKNLDTMYRKVDEPDAGDIMEFQEVLFNDLNTPAAISIMLKSAGMPLVWMGQLIGLLTLDLEDWFKNKANPEIEKLILLRNKARKEKNYVDADIIRKTLLDKGVIIEDKPDGTTNWRKV